MGAARRPVAPDRLDVAACTAASIARAVAEQTASTRGTCHPNRTTLQARTIPTANGSAGETSSDPSAPAESDNGSTRKAPTSEPEWEESPGME
ncbi:MAG: hypothetical protein AMXMBFR83_11100 [Phycisphaerae bacterium]